MPTNPFYSFSAQSLEDLVMQLNIALATISDRLDAIEGKRGAASISSDLTVTGQVLVNDPDGNEIQGFKT